MFMFFPRDGNFDKTFLPRLLLLLVVKSTNNSLPQTPYQTILSPIDEQEAPSLSTESLSMEPKIYFYNPYLNETGSMPTDYSPG